MASSGWSIGVLGALAEFERDKDEAATCRGANVVTARGAISLTLSPGARAIAYELPSARPDSWLHGIALCLPRTQCAMHARKVVTEVGYDALSVRREDREAFLFDLGLGDEHCDFYVRSAEPAHVERLRAAVGLRLLDEPGLFADIVDMSPQRVFVSALGRIEIYQRIGAPHGVTPHGPHTHLLPRLLRTGHARYASLPVPHDWVVCATIYPAHPVRDRAGVGDPFDVSAHDAFQELLRQVGDADTLAVKHAVWRAIRSAAAPASFPALARRHARLARRVALRQLSHMDGPSPQLAAWQDEFDPAARSLLPEDKQDETHSH
jgi:hypothetical protein